MAVASSSINSGSPASPAHRLLAGRHIPSGPHGSSRHLIDPVPSPPTAIVPAALMAYGNTSVLVPTPPMSRTTTSLPPAVQVQHTAWSQVPFVGEGLAPTART